MASLTDVQDALADLVTTAVYPNGTDNPSVAGVDIQIYSGWPNPAILETDIKAGKAHISIFKMPGMERNTSRFSKVWQEKSINEATLFLTTDQIARTVTITGTVTLPQACMIIVNKIGYAYAVLEEDTLESIASALADLIPGATADDNVITIPSGYSIVSRVTVAGESVEELKRQQQGFSITVWAPSQTVRSLIGDAIDVYLADVERLILPDNFYAQLIYQRTDENDSYEKVILYQRKLMYLVEYATTKTETDYTISDINADITIQHTSLP